MKCPNCHFENPQDFRYCGNCGHNFATHSVAAFDGERRQATVLFSDLSGYTAMTAAMDPEEVKNLMSEIFAAAGAIVGKYEGTVERFFGDEIMALFGVPIAHEDDALRAIRTAREIHDAVTAISGDYEKQIGRVLRMHSGINTGLMVTGDEYIGKSRHGLTGDTINLGKRLTSIAGEDEIIIGPDTWSQAQGHFLFQELSAVPVRGKADPIQVYKVLSPKEQPSTLHRTHGARADLIGRDKEMAALMETVERLDQGRGSIISICGEAGTGKSRLTREFKDRLDLDKIQWFEGHAYGYTQNTPYYPLIDLLTHAFGIEEGDAPERVRQKIESGLANLLGADNQAAAYIGGLFSLSYPEASRVSPEFWKSRLHGSIREIVSALAERGPTVICFEDLHWSDPSFIKLLKALLQSLPHSVLFLCVYRPAFNLFDGQKPERLDQDYQEIRLQELSAFDAQAMLRSLLKSEDIPAELMDFIGKKAEGNPFYLEEVINSLIESEILTPDNGSWQLTRAIGEADIPSSISGVLTARVDRLQKDAKRVLQEASVIGRAFFYQILKIITDLKVPIDDYLSGIEQLDLIRVRAFEPDLEYIFKHALTQEVVYNGILKKERQEIHERIGLAIEMLFKDRLSEFYETLAFHFKKGRSLSKASDYLIKSAEKSLKRYAIDGAHRYYKDAFEILKDSPEHREVKDRSAIELLIDWALVFYYRGDFRQLTDLLLKHKEQAESLADQETKGMYYAWLGFALLNRGRISDSFIILTQALKIGEDISSARLIGYASTWLTWNCADLGDFDAAIGFGVKAQESAKQLGTDHYLYFKSLAGIGYTYFYMGEGQKAFEIGEQLINYGNKVNDVRCLSVGHYIKGYGFCAAGNFDKAIKSSKLAIEITSEPFYSQIPKIILGLSQILSDKLPDAKKSLSDIIEFSESHGFELAELPARALLAALSIADGEMSKGFKYLKTYRNECMQTQRKSAAVLSEQMLGKIYMQLMMGTRPGWFIIFRNIGFLIQHLPFAERKAVLHLKTTINLAEEIGAKGVMAQACFDLGLCYKHQKRMDQARRYIDRAIKIFNKCKAKGYLLKARQALESMS